MTCKIERLDGDLAIRLPASLCEALGLSEGDDVRVTRNGATLRIANPQINDPTLEELLSRITQENRHDPIDWGPPVGKELW